MSAARWRCPTGRRNWRRSATSPNSGPAWAIEATKSYLFLRAASIYGGTNEIQKNILTKAVLGL